MSYGYLLQWEQRLRAEVEELLALSEKADRGELPPGWDVSVEIALRQERLLNLEQAQAVLEARAQECYAAEQAEYEAKMQERERKEKQTGRKPTSRTPQPPSATGPEAKDQYNFTEPDSRIMKNSTNKEFDQHYNVQVAVDQDSMLIVGHTLSNHPTDREEALPRVDAIPAKVGKSKAAALHNGYWSPTNVEGLDERRIEPYIATGRDSHHQSWQERFAQEPEPPDESASLIVQMAYKLKTTVGKLIYGLRKSTAEPVIGIIKKTLGFRQFALRGRVAVAGEWCLVCLAYDLRRMHRLVMG